jgi:PAS domain S-box-containing protein
MGLRTLLDRKDVPEDAKAIIRREMARRETLAAGDAVLLVDAETDRVVGASDSLGELTSRPVDELLGLPRQEVLSLGGERSALDGFARGAGIDHRADDALLARGDGGVTAVETSTRTLRCEHRALSVWELRRAARRRTAERAASDGEDELRRLFRHASVGLCLVRPDGRILRANAKQCEIAGRSEEELLSMTYMDITHPDDVEANAAAYARVLSGEIDTLRLEKRYVRPDGSHLWVRTMVSMAPTPAHDGACLIGIVEDIDARKRAENELALANADLEQFAYAASHDLREPLRVITSYIDILEEDCAAQLDDTAREYLAYIQGGAARMARLIHDLLAYARVGRDEEGSQPVDAEEALATVLDALRLRVAEAGAVVTWDPLPRVRCWPSGLTQVLQNLVVNAITFRSVRPPRVHVSAECDGSVARFRVTDNGIGIDPAFHERIFQVFRRLHTREECPGSGIGLAICRRVVERAGGRIWVESVPEAGSAFVFTLPLAPPEGELAPPLRPVATEEARSTASG